jgi:hypothetical protein
LSAAVGFPEQVVGLKPLKNPNEKTNVSEESILQEVVLKPLKKFYSV